MIRRPRFLSNEEREAAEREGRREGKLKGKREGRRELLAQQIGWRFPTATPEFIQNVLNQYSESHTKELSLAILEAETNEEFQNRILAFV